MSTRRILGSVGTDHHPFPRLIEWVAQATAGLPDVEVLVQRGATPDSGLVPTVDYMSAVDLEASLLTAAAVVCHGGPGTISGVRRAGHLPLVIPRNPAFGEHVDDHQMRFCAHNAEQGRIILIDSVEQLREKIALAISGNAPRVVESSDSVAAALRLGSLVQDLVADKLTTRPLRQRLLFRRIP